MTTTIEPLVLTPSDTIDTTEEAVAALIVRRHAVLAAAGDERGCAVLRDLGEAISKGAHWDVPGIAV